ncbi:DUF4190 domain-containing protein [Aeromicrobium sp. Leaf350]|uniref:DUF4190 domain-containing protein n=1 Tax=Aeromicrobium sp. Leaf350 TaxID=2876565 RepID=UPI001E5FCD09|nr:DUF4190 domain-containing protein [Aeromicrobium sp. Leaf350]
MSDPTPPSSDPYRPQEPYQPQAPYQGPDASGGTPPPQGPPANPYGQQPPGPQPQFGGGPYPPYGAPQPMFNEPLKPNHPQATTSMVLGIISIVGGFMCLLPLFLAPAAWIMGRKAVREIDASGGQLGGRGEAQTGFVTGIIGTILLVLGILAVIAVIVIIIVAADSSDSDYYYDSLSLVVQQLG